MNYSLRLYFRNLIVVNKPSKFGKTIFVSNHAAAFMDPLVIATLNRSVVYFLVRSDVFTSLTRPFFWMAHMLPIYRKGDGVNTKEKNLEVFKKCTQALLRNRNLLIFAEGFTDDVFIRRLKPIKKGAVRIGFTALEECNWEEDIYIAAIGLNYSDPSRFGSDVLIKNSQPIHLNPYKLKYLENPAKVISELTQDVEVLLKSQITNLEEIENSSLHERIMMLQRKGMADLFNNDSDLESRWMFSSKLADFINNSSQKETVEINDDINSYFQKLQQNGISDDLLFDTFYNSIPWYRYVIQVLILPFSLLGMVHCGLFYWLIKRFVENKFRRAVFWGSTKLILMILVAGIINMSVFIFIPPYIGWPLTVIYFLLIPLFGFVFYRSLSFWNRIFKMNAISRRNLQTIKEQRMELTHKINTFVQL